MTTATLLERQGEAEVMNGSEHRFAQRVPPVLLLTFNRPGHVARVLERIKEARPPSLYVACDGPRRGRSDDLANVSSIRQTIESIDWCGTVRTLFREENLGCGRAVSEAVTWFLDEAAEGIILEDDCLPDISFFRFSGELLDRYRNTSNVMQVAGYNLLSGWGEGEADYRFSHLGWQWGWATWRRAWAHFDLSMSNWPRFKRLGLHRAFPFSPRRVSIFDATFRGQIDTWDYQWHYAMAASAGLSVVPTWSLVENIGFGPGATHATSRDGQARYRVPVRAVRFPLRHAEFVFPDSAYDKRLIRTASQGVLLAGLKHTLRRLRSRRSGRS